MVTDVCYDVNVNGELNAIAGDGSTDVSDDMLGILGPICRQIRPHIRHSRDLQICELEQSLTAAIHSRYCNLQVCPVPAALVVSFRRSKRR